MINGTSAAETLNGTPGDDIIIGAGGADTLTGGAGSDTFRYLGPWFSERGDRITDFEVGVDKLDLAALLPSATHSSPNPFDEYIIVEPDGPNTRVSVRVDGDDNLGKVRPILTLEGSVNLTAGDFIFSTDSAPPEDTPGVLAFGNANYTVSEDGGNAEVTLVRSGGSDGEVSIDVNLSNGSATAPDDYDSTSQTATFADGETTTTITIPIEEDSDVEGDETFTLSLSNPTGGASIGGQDSSTVTIQDNDTSEETNGDPTAVPDAATTEEGRAIEIDVLNNDSDPENDALAIASVSNPDNGTAVVDDENQTVIYTPDSNFTGEDTFSYTINDGNVGTDTANITVTVDPADVTGGSTDSTSTLSFLKNKAFSVNGDDETTYGKFTLNTNGDGDSLEIGLVKFDNADGTVDGVDPNDSNYSDAVVKNSTILVSSPEGNDIDLALSRTIPLLSGHLYSLFIVQDGTADGYLLNGDGLFKLGSDFGGSDDSSPLSYTFSDTEDAYFVEWDSDGADFGLKIEFGEMPPIGTKLQGGREAEVVDMRDLNGTYEVLAKVSREAALENSVGFYHVDSLTGTITSDGTNLNPGDPGYAKAAVKQWVDGNNPDLSTSGGMSSYRFTVEAGKILVPFLVVDGAPADLFDSNPNNDPEVFFPYIEANSDGFDHVVLLGDNTFGFEDQTNGGDQDYDDIVVHLTLEAI
jgi:hypothetical protein